MEFIYLGTAAAEGYPGIFCCCENCKKARAGISRNIRTRPQAIINDDLLLDFGADTYMHLLNSGMDWSRIQNVLITHTHPDHFYVRELENLQPGMSKPADGFHLNFYGNSEVVEAVEPFSSQYVSARRILPFIPMQMGKYTVVALPAWHSAKEPLIYSISDGATNILYAHDTDYFPEETWEFLGANPVRYDLISFDCAMAFIDNRIWRGHMSIQMVKECRDRMSALGLVQKDTKLILNHFSHNCPGTTYEELMPIAAAEGFLVSYDGMKISL